MPPAPVDVLVDTLQLLRRKHLSIGINFHTACCVLLRCVLLSRLRQLCCFLPPGEKRAEGLLCRCERREEFAVSSFSGSMLVIQPARATEETSKQYWNSFRQNTKNKTENKNKKLPIGKPRFRGKIFFMILLCANSNKSH